MQSKSLTPERLVIDGFDIAAISKIEISQQGAEETWVCQLVLEATRKQELSRQREALNARLEAMPQRAQVMRDGEESAAILLGSDEPSVLWKVAPISSLNPTIEGRLTLSGRNAHAIGRMVWNRTKKRSSRGQSVEVNGEVSGFNALESAHALRDSFGQAISERVQEFDDGLRVVFKFEFASDGEERQINESISAREERQVVTHRPIASNAPLVHQHIGGLAVVATQSGSAASREGWPEAATPRWPAQMLSREIVYAEEDGQKVTRWDFTFALDAMAQALAGLATRSRA